MYFWEKKQYFSVLFGEFYPLILRTAYHSCFEIESGAGGKRSERSSALAKISSSVILRQSVMQNAILQSMPMSAPHRLENDQPSAALGANHMNCKWNRKNSLGIIAVILFFFAVLPGCDDSPARPGEGFYSYPGYRDWWRIPLKFPFQILIVDAFDNGSLEKYDSSQNIAEPNISSHSVVNERVTAVSTAKAYVAFRCEKGEYGIFTYQSEQVVLFDSEALLQKYLNDVFPDETSLKWLTLQKCYDEIWAKMTMPSEK